MCQGRRHHDAAGGHDRFYRLTIYRGTVEVDEVYRFGGFSRTMQRVLKDFAFAVIDFFDVKERRRASASTDAWQDAPL
jgi:hypothetical protein